MPKFGLTEEFLPGDDDESVGLIFISRPIRELFHTANKRKLDSVSRQMMLLDYYETEYGIFDHARFSDTRPLALVGMHPKEDPASYSLAYRTFYRFADHDVFSRFGINIKEFLDLPHEYVELIFKIMTERTGAEAPGIDRAIKEIERMGR